MLTLIIEGYVVQTYEISSGILTHPTKGRHRERILPRTFNAALKQTENVRLLLNHSKHRPLGSIKGENLLLWEDETGLAIKCSITDPDVIRHSDKIRGFSFGFKRKGDYWRYCEDGILLRNIFNLELTEVSLICGDKEPAYEIPSQITKKTILKGGH